MKIAVTLFLASFFTVSANAQLKDTRWKGTLRLENPTNVILDFKKDTLSIYTISDSTVVETMKYMVSNNVFTIQKIVGQSDCDNATIGKYQFEVRNENLYVKMITDLCDDRSSVLDTTKWFKWNVHPEVEVDESILKQYVGLYELDSQHRVSVTLENGRLQVESQTNNLPKSSIYAESNTRFLVKVAGVELDFVKDANGKVIKFISHEEKDYELKKIK